MTRKTEVNIKCPTCGTTMVTAYGSGDIKGILRHKCGRCRRYWNVDYTAKIVVWAKGKEESTPIKEFRLNLPTGI